MDVIVRLFERAARVAERGARVLFVTHRLEATVDEGAEAGGLKIAEDARI